MDTRAATCSSCPTSLLTSVLDTFFWSIRFLVYLPRILSLKVCLAAFKILNFFVTVQLSITYWYSKIFYTQINNFYFYFLFIHFLENTIQKFLISQKLGDKQWLILMKLMLNYSWEHHSSPSTIRNQ